MRNKVMEILESNERIEREINFIVNSFRVYNQDEKAKRMRKYLEKLVTHVRQDMIEIHDLK